MQIVIDIDDEVYKEIEEGLYDKNVRKMAIAIGNGTQLPKGHGRLIDVNDIEWAKHQQERNYIDYEVVDWEDIKNAPTIIEADAPNRRKGTPLEENDSGYNCENWIP